jgi:hypothetical protein
MTDFEATHEFFHDAAGFKSIDTRIGKSFIAFGHPDYCQLISQEQQPGKFPIDVLRNVSVTMAVSNLKTAARQAKRRQGQLCKYPVGDCCAFANERTY